MNLQQCANKGREEEGCWQTNMECSVGFRKKWPCETKNKTETITVHFQEKSTGLCKGAMFKILILIPRSSNTNFGLVGRAGRRTLMSHNHQSPTTEMHITTERGYTYTLRPFSLYFVSRCAGCHRVM